MKVECSVCGVEVDDAYAGQGIEGIYFRRNKGLNHISAKRLKPVFYCRICAERLDKHQPTGQGALL